MEPTVQTFSDVISNLDFSLVSENILLAIAASAGFVIGMIALKKGYAFLKRQIKGA